MTDKILKFPSGFLWGASTSAYQVEGGLVNDWSEWEKSPRRLAELKAKVLDPLDFQSGQACDSWNRTEEDIACLKQINATAYRFSVDWSRIEPEEGRFDESALNHYASFVARLREENIEPFVTLWHWPIPLWLKAKGGFESSDIVEYFKTYVERVALALPTVKFWVTVNEPTIYAGNSFLKGIWPPQKKNIFLYFRVLNNLARAHRVAYDVLKNVITETKVGVASPNIYFENNPGLINKLLKLGADWWWNNHWLDKIKDKQDFIGLNFYFHNLINFGFSKNKNEKINDLGWELYPAGIYYVLMKLHQRYHKPVYIMENGLADEADTQRAWYLKEILKNVNQAVTDGVDVRGYLHWSLIDNFEWAHGFGPKFGLFSVDRKTFIRSPRPSVKIYSEIAKNNELKV